MMTFTFSFHGSFQIACNYWQEKNCSLFRNIFALHLTSSGVGFRKLKFKAASICFVWLDGSCAALLLPFIGCVFLNPVFSLNGWNQEKHSMIMLVFCKHFCHSMCSKLLSLTFISKYISWEVVVAGWAARADMRVCERRMTDVLQACHSSATEPTYLLCLEAHICGWLVSMGRQLDSLLWADRRQCWVCLCVFFFSFSSWSAENVCLYFLLCVLPFRAHFSVSWQAAVWSLTGVLSPASARCVSLATRRLWWIATQRRWAQILMSVTDCILRSCHWKGSWTSTNMR